MESLGKLYDLEDNSICVGNFAFVIRVVIGDIMTVGEYLFPMSFCMTKTGLKPPCSLPKPL